MESGKMKDITIYLNKIEKIIERFKDEDLIYIAMIIDCEMENRGLKFE